MLEGWSDFFLMLGSSGVALIGLLFVVITLNTGSDRDQALANAGVYMSPIVFHLACCFVLSAAAMAHGISDQAFGWGTIALAGVGMAVCARALMAMRRPEVGVPDASDPWFYGAAPMAVYLMLAATGAAVLARAPGSVGAVGGTGVALLMLSIRNAWDLVTWLAPDKKSD